VSPWKDIKTDDPNYVIYKTLYDLGIMQGSGDKFKPKGKVTRKQLAVVIYKTLKLLKAIK
jgi:hypothetical protein